MYCGIFSIILGSYPLDASCYNNQKMSPDIAKCPKGGVGGMGRELHLAENLCFKGNDFLLA